MANFQVTMRELARQKMMAPIQQRATPRLRTGFHERADFERALAALQEQMAKNAALDRKVLAGARGGLMENGELVPNPEISFRKPLGTDKLRCRPSPLFSLARNSFS